MPAVHIPITFLITDLHRGGSPLMLASLAAGLKRWGGGNVFRPEVVSIAPLGDVATDLRDAGIDVFSLEAAGNRDSRVVGRFIKHLRDAQARSGSKGERRIVMSILIHANILASLARPRLAGSAKEGENIRWIHSIHTVQEKPRWHWVVQGMINRFADALVVPSRAILRKLERFGPLPAGNAAGNSGGGVVIPNGIDVRKFADALPIPADARPWPASPNARVIGYLGRFDPVKRIDLLIDALAALLRRDPERYADLHLALVGYGALEEDLRARSANAGLADRVHFPVSDGLGLGGTREPERWLKTFDLFCSPSPAEGFGLTLLEARAAGLPVIACGTEAVRETLAGDPGVSWLDPEASAPDLAALLARLLARSGDASGTRPVASSPVPPELLDSWTIDRMVARYATWLREFAQIP